MDQADSLSPLRAVRRPSSVQLEPEDVARVVELVERSAEVNSWKCCSGSGSKECVRYSVQVTFAACLVVFCMIQIIRGYSEEPLYWSLLSSTVATFVPAPSLTTTTTSAEPKAAPRPSRDT